MICPKCRFEQPDGNAECPECGVLFARLAEIEAQRASGTLFQPRPAPLSAAARGAAGTEGADGSSWGETARALLFTWDTAPSPAALWGRTALYAFFVLWGLRFFFASVESNYVGDSFMHLINLPFHEAGHLFFGFLGDFLRALGGTLMQLLIPTICLGAFLLQTRDPFAGSVALWWLAENFMDIAPYMADARSGELLLLGGVTGRDVPGYHDWENVLGTLNLLPHDKLLAGLSYNFGRLLMLAAFAWGARVLWLQWKEQREQREGGI